MCGVGCFGTGRVVGCVGGDPVISVHGVVDVFAVGGCVGDGCGCGGVDAGGVLVMLVLLVRLGWYCCG